MEKLTLPPDQTSYFVKDGVEVVSTSLDGGASRYRTDIIGASSIVNVLWSCNPNQYRYLKGFFNITADKGANAFLVDLYMDREILTEHEAHFVAGSFKLASQKGNQFVITAQLEAVPITLTTSEKSFEEEWISFYADTGLSLPEIITVSETGNSTVNSVHELHFATINGRHSWVAYISAFPESSYIRFTGVEWEIFHVSTGETWTLTSTSEVPEKTGWSVGSLGSPAPTLEY